MENIRHKRGDVTTDPMDFKRTIKGYYEELSTHKFDNLDEINKFLKDTIC